MKKPFSIIVFIIALAIVMTACDYKNPPGLDHVDNSEYYVMYTISPWFATWETLMDKNEENIKL